MRLQLVEKLWADAMTRAKFVNAIGVSINRRFRVKRLAANYAGAHSVFSILTKAYGER
jgi:hypothetical protein